MSFKSLLATLTSYAGVIISGSTNTFTSNQSLVIFIVAGIISILHVSSGTNFVKSTTTIEKTLEGRILTLHSKLDEILKVISTPVNNGTKPVG